MARKIHKNLVRLATPIPKDRRIDIETAAVCGLWARNPWVDWDWEDSYTAENARNLMINRFFESPATHIFFIDCDTIPPKNALDKLLSRDVPIASGIYPIYSAGKKAAALSIHPEPKQTLMDWKKAKEIDKPFRAEAVGGGCLLIQRGVLEFMKWPFFSTVYNPKGITTGHDFHFCKKAIKEGFSIIVDPTVECGHFRGQMLNEVF